MDMAYLRRRFIQFFADRCQQQLMGPCVELPFAQVAIEYLMCRKPPHIDVIAEHFADTRSR